MICQPIDAVVTALFDAAFLPAVRNPALIGLTGGVVKRVVFLGDRVKGRKKKIDLNFWFERKVP